MKEISLRGDLGMKLEELKALLTWYLQPLIVHEIVAQPIFTLNNCDMQH
jgi:hypothetical protein